MQTQPGQPNSRKKIGLALGGGGAKGLAHIGVIKVLEKYGIPIDFIAGTSMGALVGGWYAARKKIKILETLFLEIDDSEAYSMNQVMKERRGVLFGDKAVVGRLEEAFRDLTFNDCQMSFAVVATDVATGEKVILDKGKLIDAVRASISMPLIFKPVKHDGRLLMDGGFVDPVPADVVRDMGADFVIAVDVSSRWLNIPEANLKVKNVPAVMSEVFSAIEYQVAKQILQCADIILRPAVLGYDWLAFNKAKEIIEKGRDEAMRNLWEIQDKTGYHREQPETLFEKIVDFFLYE
ncbi:MAG: patatin-like phospholipase family protein [Candidatus Portnoybacteria bacterium]|nr:patatin-like phospholipase family protein [Candidatus Portnoybacteria bacterium]